MLPPTRLCGPWGLHCLQPGVPPFPPLFALQRPGSRPLLHQGFTPPESTPRQGRAWNPESLQSGQLTGSTWKGWVEWRPEAGEFSLITTWRPSSVVALPACKPAHNPTTPAQEEPSSSKLSGKQLIDPCSPTACPGGC